MFYNILFLAGLFLGLNSQEVLKCSNGKRDVIFLLDASLSQEDDDIKAMLELVKSYGEKVPEVGKDYFRVGVDFYANGFQHGVLLNQSASKEEFISAVNDLVRPANLPKYGSKTGYAINESYYVSMSDAYGGREDAIKQMVIFFDGAGSNKGLLSQVADDLNALNVLRSVIVLQGRSRGSVDAESQSQILLAANPDDDTTIGSPSNATFMAVLNDHVEDTRNLCPPTPTYPQEKCSLMDVVFLVDISTSTSMDDFTELQSTAIKVSEYVYDNLCVNAQVSFVSFASNIVVDFKLTDGTDKVKVQKLINGVEKKNLGAATKGSAALQAVRVHVFPKSGRSSTAQIIVLLYDGQTRTPTDEQAKINNEAGIITIVATVPGRTLTNTAMSRYRLLANNDERRMLLDATWENLAQKVNDALAVVCD